MKPKYIITCLLTVLCLILILSCRQRPMHKLLLAADSLASANPDSALALLQSMGDSIGQRTEAERMFYRLLCIKARDKAYIKHTSDTAILPVVHYYEKQEDEGKLAEAYYYAGRVYYDLGDAPQAMAYFLKATETPEGQDNDGLAARIHTQTGMLYLYQDLYRKAMQEFRLAYHHNLQTEDRRGIIFSLRDFGRTYSVLHRPDSAIYYYLAASRLAEETNEDYLQQIINGELAAYYIQRGKYEEARACMNIAFHDSGYRNRDMRRCIAAQYYLHTLQPDSARYYFGLLAKEAKSAMYRSEGYKGLSIVEQQAGNDQAALAWLRKYQDVKDSIAAQKREETIHKAEVLYSYQEKELESKRLEVQRQQRMTYITSLVAFCFILLLLAICYQQYKKQKIKEIAGQREKVYKLLEERYKQSMAYIEENERRIIQLNLDLQAAEASKDSLKQELLLAQKDVLEKTNKQIEAFNKAEEKTALVLQDSEIYQKLFRLRDKAATADDWAELDALVENMYPSFVRRLLELYPLNETELHICLLLKIRIPLKLIPGLVARSKQSVSSIRKRLYGKIFKKEGTPDDWDKFIESI